MNEELLASEITDRKSVTNWTSKKITMDTWRILFEAARMAPSSWNHQPARYIVLYEEKTIQNVCNALHRCNRWAEKAPGLIVQVASPEDDDRVEGKEYYLYDCGLAMMSLIFQAQSMGMSARQMIGWDEQEIKKILQIPERFRIVVLVGIGYPSNHPVPNLLMQAKRQLTSQHKRYALEHLVSWGKWGVKSE